MVPPHGWRDWAEVVWSDPRAHYVGDTPHTWIGAEFATAVRRMLVRENGTFLELFRAVPDAWDAWWEGDGIALRQLPTTLGEAHVRQQRDRASASVGLALAGPGPERVTIRFPGVKYAQADGKPYAICGAMITVPNFGRLEIEF